jgi:hypothetical protein
MHGALFGVGALDAEQQESLTEILRELRLSSGDFVP